MLSFSHYGPSGNGELPFEPEKPEILQAASRPISSADSRSQSRQGVSPQKLSKKQQEQQQQLLEQQRLLEGQQAKERKLAEEKYKEQQESLMRHNKYQQLFASTQYGLHVHCQVMADAEADPSLTDGSDGFVVARQCYPVQTSGTQDCEEVLSQTAFKEKSRCYLPSGSVVRYMHDSSIVVQCADGSVYHTANPAQVEAYKSAFSQTTESQMDQAAKEATETIERVMSTTRVTFADETDKDKVKKPPSNAAVQVWVVTTPDGTRYLWRKEKQPPSIQEKGDGVEVPPSEAQDEVTGEAALDPCPADENVTRIVPLTKLECFPATDPVSKEVRAAAVMLSIYQWWIKSPSLHAPLKQTPCTLLHLHFYRFWSPVRTTLSPSFAPMAQRSQNFPMEQGSLFIRLPADAPSQVKCSLNALALHECPFSPPTAAVKLYFPITPTLSAQLMVAT